jgi:hypothetical protein
MRGNVHLQKGIVAGALDINQIWHFGHFFKLSKSATYPFATVQSGFLRCQQGSLINFPAYPDALPRDMPYNMGFGWLSKPPIIKRPCTGQPKPPGAVFFSQL